MRIASHKLPITWTRNRLITITTVEKEEYLKYGDKVSVLFLQLILKVPQ